MSANRMSRAVVSLAAVVPLLAATVHARTLDLPVRVVGRPPVRAPAYLGERLSIRLHPWAARQAAMGGRARHAETLGLSGPDRVARSLGGAWFEPEFKGETAPPEGSDRTDFSAFYLVHLPAAADLAGALDAFAALPEVMSAEPIAVASVIAIPNDSLWAISDWFYHPPSRRDVHAPEAWDLTTGDTSIVVAIVDTGLIPYHPDIGGRVPGPSGQVWTNWVERGGRPGIDDDGNGFVDDLWGWDFVDLPAGSGVRPGEDGFDEEGDPNDFVGHGTAVAGIVGAIANNGSGIAGTVWQARLMPLRAGWASSEQPSGEVSMSFAAQAVRYATRMGARVINCSFSNPPSLELDLAIVDAVRAGLLVVFGAGNYGSPNAAGARQEVMTVGAVDRDDVVAPWSNLAPWVDLCAPGTAVATTAIARPGTDSLGLRQPSYVPDAGGTSFAAPFVAGGAALVQARRLATGLPLLDPMTLLLHLRETADDIGPQNPTIRGFGAGRLNLARAVASPPASRVVRIPGRMLGAPLALPRGGGRHWVAIVTESWKLVILDDTTGETVRVVTLPARPVSGPAAADMGTGYGIAVFVALAGGRVAGYGPGGDPLPGWPVASAVGGAGEFALGVALGDLDGDGTLEVVAARPGGFQAWHPDGRLMISWNAPGDVLSAPVALADLDLAPGMEVIAGTRARLVHALRADGAELAHWPVMLGSGFYGVAAPVVTRFGADTAPTVLVADGNHLHALRGDGSLRFRVPLWDYAAQDPALADLDGDGSDEVVVASGPELAAFDSTGTMVWTPNEPYAPWTQDVPVVGFLRSAGEPAVVIRAALELMAFDPAGGTLPGYPRPGGAGALPTISNRDGGLASEILAGTDADSLLYMYDLGPGSWSALAHPWPTPRGDFARTGSHLGPAHSPTDTVPPPPVTDLAASVSGRGVEITWTAPADAGTPPRATSYELRWALSPLDEATFASAVPVVGLPVPSDAGTPEHMRVTGLGESQRYYFALKSRDAGWNVSELSNGVSAFVPEAAPARVSDLRGRSEFDASVSLEWTATGDDSLSGRPQRYRVRAADHPFDEGGFANAPIERIVTPTVEGGALERAVVKNLPTSGPLWFALIAEDDRGLVSPMSNLLGVPTPVVRPGPIADLRIQGGSDAGLTLAWAAVGDDSVNGRPIRYLVRAAPTPLDEQSFASAPFARVATPSKSPGETEVFTFGELPPGQPIWIGLEAEDDLGLRSALSNVLATTFNGIPPAPVTDLRVEAKVDSGALLRWPETGDDGYAGRASRYRLAADTTALTQAGFDAAPFQLRVGATALRGTQFAAFAGLPLGRTVWLALEAEDDIGARSAISNVVTVDVSLARPAPVTGLTVLGHTDSTLTVGWTATGDDSLTGRPVRYELRADPAPIDEASFESAAYALASPATVAAGGAERATFERLPLRQQLYLAVEAEDDAGTRSGLAGPFTVAIAPVPPAAVPDLAIEAATENGIAFRWTASGDDGSVGQARRYLLRGAPEPITEASFDQAPIADSVAASVPSGSLERFRLGGVPLGQSLWFALEAEDRAGARSALSNVVPVTVLAVAPAPVSDLRVETAGDSSASLRWTATGDDGATGRPRLYEIRAGAAPLDEAGFAAAPYARQVAAAVDAGGDERCVFGGLPRGRRWWFALKAVDAGGTSSALSNPASARLGIGGPLGGRAGAALAPLLQPSRPPVLIYWQSDEGVELDAHTIALFDLNGRCVRRLAVGTGVGGVVAWDGRDERGARLGAGLYFARFTDRAPGATARILLLP